MYILKILLPLQSVQRGWGGGATYFHGGPLQITFEYPSKGRVFIYNYPHREMPSNLALTTHSGKRQAQPHDSLAESHPKGGYSAISSLKCSIWTSHLREREIERGGRERCLCVCVYVHVHVCVCEIEIERERKR